MGAQSRGEADGATLRSDRVAEPEWPPADREAEPPAPGADNGGILELLIDSGLVARVDDAHSHAPVVPASVVASLASTATRVAQISADEHSTGGVGSADGTARLGAPDADGWHTPLRVAALEEATQRSGLRGHAALTAAEQLVRLVLRPHLQEVVAAHDDEAGLAEALLSLLLASCVVLEVDGGTELELSPAFLQLRRDLQAAATRRRAAQRREDLGALLALEGDDLSGAYVQAGDGPSLGELEALHRFTGLVSLPLWQAARTLRMFRRHAEPLDGDSIDAWLTGRCAVLFSSSFSRPARVFEAMFEEATRGLPIRSAVVDADREERLCERFGVDRPPMLLLFDDHTVVDRQRWVGSAIHLRAHLERFLGDEAPDRSRKAETPKEAS